MKAKLAFIIAIVSLVDCLGVLLIWLVNLAGHDFNVNFHVGREQINIQIIHGIVLMESWQSYPGRLAYHSADSDHGAFRFWYLVSPAGQTTLRLVMISFPCWFLAFLLAWPPAIWWSIVRRRQIREKRRAAGCCIHCGYDLRASSERCPECGTLIAARPDAVSP